MKTLVFFLAMVIAFLLGFTFGWPGVLLAMFLGFVVGAAVLT